MPGFAAFQIGIEKPGSDVPTALNSTNNNAITRDFDDSPDSSSVAGAEGELYDEYDDESELPVERDNFEDSE
ncbi:MAG: hypothetical protein ACR2QR_05145 [Woeseiaceae bacterium]